MHNNTNYQCKICWNKALTFGVGSIQLSFRIYHCVHPIHANMFSIQMLLHFSQIVPRVCTLVLSLFKQLSPRLDDNTLRVSVGLRLGSPLCRPHTCHHCGAEVDCHAIHGLSCRWSQGRHHRHATINYIIHRALSSAKIPSRLEPSGLYRSDGKRPDGITVVPWQRGKLLVWDATCPDTFAPSYILCTCYD